MLRFTKLILIIVCILLLSYQHAYAYLDPGTGSYMLQVIMATLLGGIFAIKVYWRKILELLKRGFLKQSKNDTDEAE